MIFVMVAIIWACDSRAEKEAVKTDSIQHKVLSFNLEGLTEKGEKKWDIKGESAEAVSEDEVRLSNIIAKTYGDEASAVITADNGVYNKASNNIKLETNVKATVETTDDTAKGYIDFSDRLADAKPADAAAPASPKKTKTVVTCEGEVEFDYENNLAYFSKDVKVVSDYGNIDADRITLHFDPKTRRIRDIVAEGNVKIMKDENITYSEKAIYIEDEKKVVLTGRPKLVIYQEGGSAEKFLGLSD
jgi:lipopolysaccharide export system protein LptA